MGLPGVRVTRSLVEGMMLMMYNTGDSNDREKRKLDYEELTDDFFLEKAVRRMNEVEKIKKVTPSKMK